MNTSERINNLEKIYHKYQIRKGLIFASNFKDRNEKSKQAYNTLKNEIYDCSRFDETLNKYINLCNEISPGLSNVDIISKMLSSSFLLCTSKRSC